MKNKIISIILFVCISLCLPITSYAVSGRGTQANPFRITNEEELLLLADFPECYFELENDIILFGQHHTPMHISAVFAEKLAVQQINVLI